MLRDLVSIVQFKKCETWRITCNFTKSNIPPWVFFTFFKLCKWYQIVQNITYVSKNWLLTYMHFKIFIAPSKMSDVYMLRAKEANFLLASLVHFLWVSSFILLSPTIKCPSKDATKNMAKKGKKGRWETLKKKNTLYRIDSALIEYVE